MWLTLFTGPVLLLIAVPYRYGRKTRENRESFFEVLAQQIQQVLTSPSVRPLRAEGR